MQTAPAYRKSDDVRTCSHGVGIHQSASICRSIGVGKKSAEEGPEPFPRPPSARASEQPKGDSRLRYASSSGLLCLIRCQLKSKCDLGIRAWRLRRSAEALACFGNAESPWQDDLSGTLPRGNVLLSLGRLARSDREFRQQDALEFSQMWPH